MLGSGVLGDVRQSLLRDPVEGGLDLGRKPRLVEVRLDVDRDPRVSAEGVREVARARARARSRRAPSAAARRRAAGRTEGSPRSLLEARRRQLGRRPSSWLPRPASVRAGSTSAPGPSRRAARGRVAGARAPGPRPRGAERRGRRGRRGRPRPRRAPRRSLPIRRSSSVKRGSGPRLLWAAITPIARSPTIIGTKRPERIPIAASRSPGRPRCRRASSPPVRCVVDRAPGRSSIRTGPGSCRSDPRPARRQPPRSGGHPRRGSAIRTSSASIRSRSRVAISSSRGASSVSPASALPTSVSDSSWREPTRRRLVEPRVLDRDGGLRGEQRHDLLVLRGEVGAVGLLGQVQVPVGDAAEDDRNAEEGPHQRVVRREADRPRIRREIVKPQRVRVPDQDAEDPAPAREDRRSARGSPGRFPWSGTARAPRRRGRSLRAPRIAQSSARRPSRRSAGGLRRASTRS